MADISVNSKVLIVSVGKETYGVHFGSDDVKRVEPVTEGQEGVNADSETGANIVCCDISESGKWISVCSLNRKLILCELNTLKTVSSRSLERAASRIRFTPSSDYVIVADKSGDAYKYSVNNPDESGTLILGHMSMLLDILITPDEKFIITSDRDEKIRVSCFPNSYNINSYCLGHTEFVTALNLLSHNKEVLISASGDRTLRFWDFKIGKQLLCRECSEVIMTNVINLYRMSSTDEENETNIAALTSVVSFTNTSDSSVLCTCVHNFSCCFVYLVLGNKDKLLCNLVHTIGINVVPRALAVHDSTLWIISLKKGDFLNVFRWDSQTNLFIKSENDNENQAVKCINEHLKNNIDTRSVIPQLYKKKCYDGMQVYVQKKKERLATESVKKQKVS